MKVIDTVKKSFFKYPTIYIDRDFESIKFGVLHHMFIILGNGIEWANTKNPKKGGYLKEPHYFHDRRVYDADYGKEVCDIDITPYLGNNKIYELREIDHEHTKEFISMMLKSLNKEGVLKKGHEVDELEALYKKNFIRGKIGRDYNKESKILWLESEFDKLPAKTLMPDEEYDKNFTYFLKEATSLDYDDDKLTKRNNPYPNFQKEYSCFWEAGVEYIQEDWKIEAINHLYHWKDYFNDDERIKTYSHHPINTESYSPRQLEMLKEEFKKSKNSNKVFTDWGYEPFDLNDEQAYQEAKNERWKRDLNNKKEFINETIYKLLKIV